MPARKSRGDESPSLPIKERRAKHSATTIAGGLWSAIQSTTAFFKNAAAFVVTFAGLIAVVWLGVLLVSDISAKSLMIADITVPKDLADHGYTSSVAALRLRDALDSYSRQTRTSMSGSSLSLSEDEPTIVVPTLGLPLDYVADVTARILRLQTKKTRLSGEFIEHKSELTLRLRLNEEEPIDVSEATNRATDWFETADRLLAKTVEPVFQKTEPYFVAANFYYAGDRDRAFRSATSIIATSSNDHDINVIMAHNLLGLIYENRADFAKSYVEYNAALQLDPRESITHLFIGGLYRDEGKNDLAISEFQNASRLDPTEPWSHYNLGLMFLGRREYALAIAQFKAAMYSHQTDLPKLWPLLYLGRTYEASGDFAAASSEFTTGIQLDPNDPRAFTDLGNIDRLSHEDREAVTQYETAIRIDPSYSRAHMRLADAYMNLGQLDNARAEYRAVIRLDPSNSDAYEDIALIYERQGQFDLARAAQARARQVSSLAAAGDRVRTSSSAPPGHFAP